MGFSSYKETLINFHVSLYKLLSFIFVPLHVWAVTASFFRVVQSPGWWKIIFHPMVWILTQKSITKFQLTYFLSPTSLPVPVGICWDLRPTPCCSISFVSFRQESTGHRVQGSIASFRKLGDLQNLMEERGELRARRQGGWSLTLDYRTGRKLLPSGHSSFCTCRMCYDRRGWLQILDIEASTRKWRINRFPTRWFIVHRLWKLFWRCCLWSERSLRPISTKMNVAR